VFICSAVEGSHPVRHKIFYTVPLLQSVAGYLPASLSYLCLHSLLQGELYILMHIVELFMKCDIHPVVCVWNMYRYSKNIYIDIMSVYVVLRHVSAYKYFILRLI